ncbi:sensor domain-containing diguanylate cyclase [Halomonas sp. ML-15]|uniref:sensor domain-containing diguanylate cyclase n=1 Tax=Halomonas sp. ML-15 TaxID=2773305 RepID=UPI001746B3ED|nr:sensor domain-containing diguanylate cyclase [Halomonas sp. ML-15]MBD3894679.1 sensor domain-containing diguanylate cyclase [Halomonas sp. ML-15]
MTNLHDASQTTSLGHDLLDRLQTPVWIFDIEQERMHYANAAAVKLWSADTPQALYARDFASTMSEATRLRLADYLPRLSRGEVIDEHWSFYPGGQGISLHCRCSRCMMEDGRTGMLVEGMESDIPLDVSSLRALEAMRHTPMMISVFDGKGKLLMRNPAALEARRDLTTLEDSFTDHHAAEQILQRMAHEPKCTLETPMRISEGERWHHVDLCRATDPKTSLPMIVMGEFDITPRRTLEIAQLVSKRQLELVIESLHVGLLLEDENRRVKVANHAFSNLFAGGAAPEALVGLDCREAAQSTKTLFAEPDAFLARIEELIEGKCQQAHDMLAMADGRFLERSYTPVFVGDHHHGHLWVYRDITRQRHQEADWAHQASTDALTGLANRRSFDESAKRVVRSVKREGLQAALLMIDIDRFKAINDTLGHAEGDKGLKLLADTLRRGLRDSDLPCRIGGEEFMVILPDMSAEEALPLAWRLLRQIAEASIDAKELPFYFTVSIGVTCFKATDTSLETLTRRADAALYQAKHAGRNRVTANW